MSFKALLALGLGDTSNGVIARSTPPDRALYGASKVAKTKLTVVLDNCALELYTVGMLRGFVAFPLYASLIRDQMGAANTARPRPPGSPSGRAPAPRCGDSGSATSVTVRIQRRPNR